MTEVIAKRENTGLDAWTPQQVKAQVDLVQEVMKSVMKEDEHFGVIPGTTKKTLFKPGAEKLGLTFRLRPDFEVLSTTVAQDDFICYDIRCRLFHIGTGQEWGSGLGSCNSREERYAFLVAARHCPKCDKEAIIKGKDEYGGGWVCLKKRGGCGEKYEDGDESIESQSTEKVARENLRELQNTIEKMACKRAHVAAMLYATAASDIFTQDTEDVGMGFGGGKARTKPVTFPFPDDVKGKAPKDCDLATLKKYLPTFEKAANDPKNKWADQNKKLVAAIQESIAEKSAKPESSPPSTTESAAGPESAPAGAAPEGGESNLAVEDWKRELAEADSLEKLAALWKTLSQEKVWSQFKGPEQVAMKREHDKRKIKLMEDTGKLL